MKTMKYSISMMSLLLFTSFQVMANDGKLTGAVIGSPYSVDYTTNKQSTTVNTCANAFDERLDTFFASWERSYTWAGLDLGEPYIITKVGWSPRNARLQALAGQPPAA